MVTGPYLFRAIDKHGDTIDFPPTVPSSPNQVWPMDFIADQLEDGRRYRTPNILYDFDW
ncbi:hypothetical protein GCM10007094_33770 [Pseudovibrio japonicus]|uniref:Uncharacterized protein n=1 Tax=Pseudovibrio japonicus TaxID=366534 RepID=A0ABQ3EIS4_9HYPH|nr:hypothetical protein GCM10007094_33770 [Pseudovibrio japonicus]